MNSPKASKAEIRKATSVLDQCIEGVNSAHGRISAVEEARVRDHRSLQDQIDALNARTFLQRVFGVK